MAMIEKKSLWLTEWGTFCTPEQNEYYLYPWGAKIAWSV